MLGDLGEIARARSAFFRAEALARRDFGVSRPIFVIASRKSWRSSALSMASAVAPIISTPNLLEHAHLLAATARS